MRKQIFLLQHEHLEASRRAWAVAQSLPSSGLWCQGTFIALIVLHRNEMRETARALYPPYDPLDVCPGILVSFGDLIFADLHDEHSRSGQLFGSVRPTRQATRLGDLSKTRTFSLVLSEAWVSMSLLLLQLRRRRSRKSLTCRSLGVKTDLSFLAILSREFSISSASLNFRFFLDEMRLIVRRRFVICRSRMARAVKSRQCIYYIGGSGDRGALNYSTAGHSSS